MPMDEETSETLAFRQERESFADFTKWRFNPDEILIMLEHDLKGEYYNEKKADWNSSGAKLMNDDGVRTIISLVRTSVNKVVFLSDLTFNEIVDMCRDLNLALVDTLFFRWKAFKVEKDHLDLIVAKVMNFIFVGMKQAQGGKTRDALGKMEKILRHYETPQEKKGFTFSPFGSEKGEER